MKVAILMPWIDVGGISQFTLTLSKYLHAHAYDVTVITLNEPGTRWASLAARACRLYTCRGAGMTAAYSTLCTWLVISLASSST